MGIDSRTALRLRAIGGGGIREVFGLVPVTLVIALLSACMTSTTATSPSTKGIALARIDHVALHVRDLKTSADFYKTVFGFEPINKWSNAWLVGRGASRLGLYVVPNAAAVPDSAIKLTMDHFAFLTDDAGLAAFVLHLDDLAIPHEPVKDNGILKSVFFNDPDGYKLEVASYYKDMPPAP
jgi:catechol 2,3-dioxygenase-like lactoylglutathione lyase family enzyme